MELLPHQLAPIRYLVGRCNNQHGLLLYHVQGSGKTNLGLFLAKNYPTKKLVLILPYGLDSIWIQSAKKLNVKISLILYYTNLTPELLKKHEKTIKDSILIVDEAHHLVELFESITSDRKIHDDQDENDEELKPKFDKETGDFVVKKPKKIKKESQNALIEILGILQTSRKTLLLSGTPIRENLSDIRWLVNVAAGKKILPYNEEDFKSMYYYKSPAKTFLFGYFNNIMRIKNPLNDKFIFDTRINVRALEYYQTEVTGAVLIFLEFLRKRTFARLKVKPFPNGFMSVVEKIIKPAGVAKLEDTLTRIGWPDAHNIRPGDYNKLPLIQAIYNILKDNARQNYVEVRIIPNKILNFLQDPDTVSQLICYFMFMIIAKGTFVILMKAKQKYIDAVDYDKLDLNKIKLVSPYVSYYKYDNIEFYPETKVIVESIPYTNYQLKLWIDVINDINITDQESVDLEFNRNLKEAELFKPKYLSNNQYFVKCKKIGNLTGTFNGKVNIPIKFQKIAQMYINSPKQTMIYSNFYASLLDLGDYFKSLGIKYTIFEPSLSAENRIKIKEDYFKGKINMLLLHPVYYEGFDIKGVRVFHILEPLDEYFKKEQLYYRPVRYLSHAHLPKEERNVKIIQWKCSLNSVFGYIKKNKESIRNWFATDMTTIYFAKTYMVESDYTPDDCVFNELEKISGKINDFSKKMKALKIDNSEIPLICNVYGDPHPNKSLKRC